MLHKCIEFTVNLDARPTKFVKMMFQTFGLYDY